VSHAPQAKAKGARKKLILMAGAGIAALVVLGGGFVAYKKLTAVPPPPLKLKLVVKPVIPQGQAVTHATAVVEQAKVQAAASVNEVMVAEVPAPTTKAAEPKPAEPVVAVASEPKPAEEVKPAVPSAPSVAFRGWVENLKISGVRGGANPRVFVGKNSYQRGDLVNPQLGITFEDYSDTTRLLTFRDKTGAKVERRN